jgi:nitroimidazol reductase NimA-like FMN-containing flavoprotein (pyridoxamine 5'-phosphate oxidase superfamily)
MYDDAGLEILEPAECRLLLGQVPLGRIVFTERALPAVLAVSFVVHNDAVIIGAGAGSTLAAATDDTVVAFQADDIHPGSHRGWSVTVVGRAARVRRPAELADLAGLPLRPWAPRQPDRFIRVALEVLSGRRFPLADA